MKIQALDASGQQVFSPAIMVDLSGGGCRLKTPRDIPVDTTITLDFDLPFPPDKNGLDRTKPLRQVPGRIRAALSPSDSGKASSSDSPRHLLSVEFNTLDHVQQNDLLRYVAFRQEQVLRQLKTPDPGHEHRAESRNPEDLHEVEERLHELEQALEEAGYEIPKIEHQDTRGEQQETPAPAVPSEESIDTLFKAEPQPPATPLVQPPEGASSGQTILLVEDEEEIRQLLAKVLQREGQSIAEASNGEEALNIALATHVDLVITDLMMPKMNGWRLLSSLRERHLDVPVIIITAYMPQEGQEVFTSKDIAGFLAKPIELEDLKKMVRGVFSPSAMNRELRILAADDSEDVRLLVSTYLQKAGYQVKAVRDGREALEEVKRFKPDLVLLDIVMPGLDGFEVCRQLRSHPATAELPVILLTVKTSAAYVKKAAALKVNGYIIKPFTSDTLTTRVRKALQGIGKS